MTAETPGTPLTPERPRCSWCDRKVPRENHRPNCPRPDERYSAFDLEQARGERRERVDPDLDGRRTSAGRYWIEQTKALTEPPDLLNLVATVEAIIAQVEDEAFRERVDPDPVNAALAEPPPDWLYEWNGAEGWMKAMESIRAVLYPETPRSGGPWQCPTCGALGSHTVTEGDDEPHSFSPPAPSERVDPDLRAALRELVIDATHDGRGRLDSDEPDMYQPDIDANLARLDAILAATEAPRFETFDAADGHKGIRLAATPDHIEGGEEREA